MRDDVTRFAGNGRIDSLGTISQKWESDGEFGDGAAKAVELR